MREHLSAECAVHAEINYVLGMAEGWRRAIEGTYPDELIADSQRKVSLGVRKALR